ncbi:MAG: hypothetical protein FWF57_09070 [Defluviitaleaceae bacterium]|nr:hypothetical protein [Defluviitaleaceae bacterium]
MLKKILLIITFVFINGNTVLASNPTITRPVPPNLIFWEIAEHIPHDSPDFELFLSNQIAVSVLSTQPIQNSSTSINEKPWWFSYINPRTIVWNEDNSANISSWFYSEEDFNFWMSYWFSTTDNLMLPEWNPLWHSGMN